MNTAKEWFDCERCKALGWLDDPRARAAGHTVALVKCPACDGEGEVLRTVELPDEWPPCTVCKQQCPSQLEHMESNGGQPWETCSNCGLPPEPDEDDEDTKRYTLPPAPLQRATATSETAPGPVMPVRWFTEAPKR